MINSMTYKGYTANMVFDAEDKIIVGRVQDIDDIISFHGESVLEFETNFHAAIEGYLAASRELGSAPERPAGLAKCLGAARTSPWNASAMKTHSSKAITPAARGGWVIAQSR